MAAFEEVAQSIQCSRSDVLLSLAPFTYLKMAASEDIAPDVSDVELDPVLPFAVLS